MDEGGGQRTLLFIHGLANYAPVWKQNIAYLKQFYRCIAIDLPGNGLSDKNDHPFGMKFFAESVYNFIQVLGLKNVCLVGHSMGGQVAMTTLINYPSCADALVLCAPAGFEEFTAFEKTLFHSTLQVYDFAAGDENMLRHVIENSFYNQRTQGEGVIRELVEIMRTYKANYYRKMIEACVKGMLDESVFTKLQEIKQPALVLFGRNDALIPNRLLHHTTTEKMATDGVKKLSCGKLELFADCGHFVQWERAEDVNRSIIMFLEEGSK